MSFTQEEVEQPPPAESEAEDVPEVAVKERDPVDLLGRKLRFSEAWTDEPSLPQQELVYKDTVKTVDDRYRSFDVSKKEDMDEYSKIQLSHQQRGHYRIASDERMQWSEARGSWIVTLRVQERIFKTTKTSHTDPADP